jgi:hypothetical protein
LPVSARRSKRELEPCVPFPPTRTVSPLSASAFPEGGRGVITDMSGFTDHHSTENQGCELAFRRTLDGHELLAGGQIVGRLVWRERTLNDGWWLVCEGWPALQLYRLPAAQAGDPRVARAAGESACLGFAEIILRDRLNGLVSQEPPGRRSALRPRSPLRANGRAQAIGLACRVVEWLDVPRRRRWRPAGRGRDAQAREMDGGHAGETHVLVSGLSEEAQLLMAGLLRELPSAAAQSLRREVEREVEGFGDRAVLLALARLLPAENGEQA